MRKTSHSSIQEGVPIVLYLFRENEVDGNDVEDAGFAGGGGWGEVGVAAADMCASTRDAAASQGFEPVEGHGRPRGERR